MPSSFLDNNDEPFLDLTVTCDEKWILYKNQWKPDKWLDWEEASKAFPKSNFHQKMFMVTVWWSAADLIHYNFWILAKPLYLRSMLSKLMRWTENCNGHSHHWSKERAQFFSMTVPDHRWSHIQSFKSWTNWATKLCLMHHVHQISCQLTTTYSSTSSNFCRESVSTTNRKQKMFSKSSWNPGVDFNIIVINLFLIGKNVSIVTKMCLSLDMIVVWSETAIEFAPT